MAGEVLQQLPQIEALCERLYNSQDFAERTQAEQYLRVFSASAEYVSHCKAILDSSTSPYAQLLASSSLLKVVTEQSLSPQIRHEMRSYFLNYLDSRGPLLEPFVVTSLVQLVCRMTKLGWFDDDSYRAVVDEAKRFLEKGTAEGSQGHYFLGLKILNMLAAEMNQPTPGRTLTQHRKVAVSFRDLALYKVFQMALLALRQLLSNAATDDKLREQGISLALQCLSFDFVGTCLDESAEEIGTIQVPSAWRPAIEDVATLQLFLDFYAVTEPPQSNMALECLVRLASVRRSLFGSEEERMRFLNYLVSGTYDVLRRQAGLGKHANYHEFCRLLGRLKTNYQLSELVRVDRYSEWIQLVAEFTIRSLDSWQWASASVYYLLGLWSRLVSSMPYLKGDAPSLLETYVPKIIDAYLTSRLESVRAVVESRGSSEDPLDNEEALQDQLDSLPYLCRFQYEKTAERLCALIDPLVAAYPEVAQSNAPDSPKLAVVQGQLTWLVHIIGAVIRGRLSSGSADSQESVDGDLAARVFGLLQGFELLPGLQALQVVDTQYSGNAAAYYAEHSRQRLDIAILTFFQNFRKVYVGEQVMHSSKVYSRLSERIGLRDHLMVLNVILTKVATNLKVFGSSEEVVGLTLTLFQDLAAGYMSGKLLLKLDAISYILAHHTSEQFPFLDAPANSRNRTVFYFTLSKLLFMEDTPQQFKAFAAPLQQVLVNLASASINATSSAQLRQTVPKETVIGLMRDLRGIAMATNSRRTYGMLFDWLYPAHFPTIMCCLEAWADTPEVTTALLKFMSEFVLNKTQRLTFDSSSPNGILLFREVSKVLVTYGTRVLQMGAPASAADVYGTRYKGIWVCLQILTRALAGNYVNFGVFELYGDPALKDALEVALKMALSVPLPDIMAYRKVAKAYFTLVDVLCHNHANVIAQRDTSTFAFILTSLDAGLKCLDVSVSSLCAAALDNLAAHYFRAMHSGDVPTPAAQSMTAHLQQRPELFPQLLTTLFEIVLFEDCSNQWSLSRPMLSLILVNEAVYLELKNGIIASQPVDRQPHLSSCLDKLMADVQRNLEPKNRDKFTQNLTMVRHEFRSKVT